MTKIGGSISQRQGSVDPDPDPHKNVMDPQHCLIGICGGRSRSAQPEKSDENGVLPSFRIADPHHFIIADRDPACHFNEDPDPAPHQGDANLQPMVHRLSRAPFWASTPLF
jgi:hypothetical protein